MVLGLQHCHMIRRSPPSPLPEKAGTKPPTNQPNTLIDPNVSDIADQGYRQASVLRACSEGLYTLLTVKPDGRLDWDAIKSRESGGCLDVVVKCEDIVNSLTDSNHDAGDASKTAIELAKKGIEVCGPSQASSTLIIYTTL